MDHRRHPGLPGPRRPPGEDPRLPHRTGRDRGRHRAPPRGGAGHRAGARGPARGQEAGRLRDRRGGPRRAQGTRPGLAAGVHGALGLRDDRRVPVDRQRKAGPQGAARARPVRGRRWPRAAQPARGSPLWTVRRRAWRGAGRHRRQLLRPRRPLAAGDQAGQPDPLRLRRGAGPARAVRGADRGGAVRAARRRRAGPHRAAPDAARGQVAAVVRAAGLVVPRPAGGPERHLQRATGHAHVRRSRPGRAA